MEVTQIGSPRLAEVLRWDEAWLSGLSYDEGMACLEEIVGLLRDEVVGLTDVARLLQIADYLVKRNQGLLFSVSEQLRSLSSAWGEADPEDSPMVGGQPEDG